MTAFRCAKCGWTGNSPRDFAWYAYLGGYLCLNKASCFGRRSVPYPQRDLLECAASELLSLVTDGDVTPSRADDLLSLAGKIRAHLAESPVNLALHWGVDGGRHSISWSSNVGTAGVRVAQAALAEMCRIQPRGARATAELVPRG